MKVVVTGATGNVGTALLRALADEEAVTSIVGIARRVPDTAFPKTQWARADVAEDDLASVFEGAACVVHLAWLIQPSHDRTATWRTNVLGSRRVFEAAAAAGVPALVHASSVGTYSPGPKDRLVDEAWPTGGIETSFYSRDKSDAERLLDRVEERNPEIRVVRLRPSLIFQRAMGTEVKRLFTGRWVPHRLIVPRRIPVVPDVPRLRFQVTHTDDVADAYRRAIVSDARGAFNVAAEPVLDPDALAELLGARTMPLPVGVARAAVAATWRLRIQPTPEGWLDMALQTPLMDASRIRRELGWEPRVSAGDALLELLHGFHAGAGAPTPPLRPR
ncbi:MAG TPA: NAD-dependent epimerase/dehydratase family protein [Gaiellaceae bacterium]|nr:NAD-dependent epimerase/dehydratase family protein [Gaiellaceae bacterium]